MNRTAARSVTVIPPTINPLTHLSRVAVQKRRVAGYARVSTDSDEQFTSYEAQVDYYTQYIKRNPEWEFVKVYTDEGISGTNTKHRIGFNEMIADAMSGKIDLIVTKSVSRFARNTVDSLVTIRKLKEKGVEEMCIRDSGNSHSVHQAENILDNAPANQRYRSGNAAQIQWLYFCCDRRRDAEKQRGLCEVSLQDCLLYTSRCV